MVRLGTDEENPGSRRETGTGTEEARIDVKAE